MANIFLIVEGQTEEQFYKKLVQSEYVNADGAYRHYFEVVVMPTKKNAYSRKNKGGLISYGTCLANVKRFLRQATQYDLIVLIYDYYGIHESFREHLEDENQTLEEKVNAIQQRLEDEIGNPKFKFRLQVHEYEAYLFAGSEVIARHFGETEKVGQLNEILTAASDNPELINDDPVTAPSKRLTDLFPKFGKTTDGITIAQKIGVPVIRDKCLKFNEMCQLFDDLD